MTDPFEARLRRSVESAVQVRNDPALADRMAYRAITSDRPAARPRIVKTVGVVASGGAVATTVVITLLAGGHGDSRQPPANQPTGPLHSCSGTSRPSIPPVTAYPGQSANGPASSEQPPPATCLPGNGPSGGPGTTPAKPTFHS
jgi:hypothetical protein